MARTTLVAIEKGERRIVPHELLQLASLYGRSVSSLVSKRTVTESLVTQFRAAQREMGPGFDQADRGIAETRRGLCRAGTPRWSAVGNSISAGI